MGRKAEAEALYREVVAADRQDCHAAGPQFLTVKAQALAHLGRGVEAVTALREALRLAPESGAPAFEAATVYALLGEETSAIANSETALGERLRRELVHPPLVRRPARQPAVPGDARALRREDSLASSRGSPPCRNRRRPD